MRLICTFSMLLVLAATSHLAAQARYELAYWYEVDGPGNHSCPGDACGCYGTGNHVVYFHVWDIFGNMLPNIRIEDANNPSVFAVTNNNPNDKYGYADIGIVGSTLWQFRVNDSGLASDVTPGMQETRGPVYGHYSWEMGWVLVPSGVDVTFDSALTGTPNLDSGSGCDLDAPMTNSHAYWDTDPFNWADGQYSLGGSASSFGQTFVATGNRVAMAKFQVTVGFLGDLRYGVRIRENGPGGEIVGPLMQSRWMKSDEYFPQTVRWPLFGENAAVVTPGQTYYAEIVRTDQLGASLNLWQRDNNLRPGGYPHGQLYRGGSPVAGKDAFGRIICGTVVEEATEPAIALSIDSLSPSTTSTAGSPPDSFTVTNSGVDTLVYSIAVDQPWLMTLPAGGSSTGEADTITVYYKAAGLQLGANNATITVSSAGASNSPQTIAVNMNATVRPVPGDTDGDGDVDQEDFGVFQACLTAGGSPQSDPACVHARIDSDADVDSDDFNAFVQCMTGANIPGDPDCYTP